MPSGHPGSHEDGLAMVMWGVHFLHRILQWASRLLSQNPPALTICLPLLSTSVGSPRPPKIENSGGGGLHCVTPWLRVPWENVKKTDIYWGSFSIHNFVFLTLLQLFVPRFGILFFVNQFFYYVCLSTVKFACYICDRNLGVLFLFQQHIHQQHKK